MNYTYKNIWLINFPVMMSILIEQLINITDAIFLGHVGEIELGASALAGIWYLAIYMLGFGFSLGLQVVIARRNGERHYSETGKTFFQGLFFLSGLAVFLCLFSKLFSPIILSRLITSAEVYHAVIDYLEGRIWGLLFSFPFLALRSFLVGITRTKALNVAALTAVLINIPGNWLLIFHWDMGIAGAAIASSFAEACSLAVLAIHVLRKMDKRLYGLRWSFDKSVLFHVCRVSVWSMFHSFVSVAPWFLFFVAIEHLGELQLAVANILRSISTLFFVIVNSEIRFQNFIQRQFVCRHNWLVGKQSDWSGRKRASVSAMQQSNPIRLCRRLTADCACVGIPSACCQCLYRQSGYRANRMVAVCGHVAELCLCLARLCLYECRYGNGGDTDGFHLSGNNHRRLPALSVGIEPLECTPCRLLDSGIPVRDWAWDAVRHLSET